METSNKLICFAAVLVVSGVLSGMPGCAAGDDNGGDGGRDAGGLIPDAGDAGLVPWTGGYPAIYSNSRNDVLDGSSSNSDGSSGCDGGRYTNLAPKAMVALDDGYFIYGNSNYAGNMFLRLGADGSVKDAFSLYISAGVGIEAMAVSNNNGVVVTGDLPFKLFAMEMGLDGTPVWSRTYEVDGYPFCNGKAISRIADGYVIAADCSFMQNGARNCEGPQCITHILILKIDNSGNIMWHKLYGGARTEKVASIRSLSGGGFIFTGETTSFGKSNLNPPAPYTDGYPNAWIVRLDDTGDIVMQKVLDISRQMVPYNMHPADAFGASDGFYMSGMGLGPGPIWVVKLDLEGGIIWQKNYVMGALGSIHPMTLIEDRPVQAFSYIADTGTGKWASHLGLMELGRQGDIEWNQVYRGYGNESPLLMTSSSRGFTVAGQIPMRERNNMFVYESGSMDGCEEMNTGEMGVVDTEAWAEDSIAVLFDKTVTPSDVKISITKTAENYAIFGEVCQLSE
jgi:hypothetical protein